MPPSEASPDPRAPSQGNDPATSADDTAARTDGADDTAARTDGANDTATPATGASEPGATAEPDSTGPAPSDPDPSRAATSGDAATDPDPPSRLDRFRAFWSRHRTLFWTLHSLWALATGVVVIWLARERYGFVPWVVVFLAATWASTMFFGRAVPSDPAEVGDKGDDPAARPLHHEVTSYLTRTLYQETLFFLLPFYAYSTVVRSPNIVFPALLAGLAFLSCLDLVFDRWLRRSPVFGVLFFAAVAFAALNLLLPMTVGIPPRFGTPLAAVIAVGSALPLVLRQSSLGRAARLRAAGAGAVILVVAILLPVLVPPVPLRMERATFATDIDPESLELVEPFDGAAPTERVGERLVVLVQVFAPSSVPTRVRLEWSRDGEPVRTSREVEILAHGAGFRVWDGLRIENGTVPPGRYVVVLETGRGRIFGRTTFAVTGD